MEYDDGVDGPCRVWLGHMDVPGLAMSRSLGDAIAHTAGVSSEPEFFEYEFNRGREDLILVTASDGLWEFMSDQEVRFRLHACLRFCLHACMRVCLRAPCPPCGCVRVLQACLTFLLLSFLCAVQVIDIAGATTEPRFAVDRLISESNERCVFGQPGNINRSCALLSSRHRNRNPSRHMFAGGCVRSK